MQIHNVKLYQKYTMIAYYKNCNEQLEARPYKTQYSFTSM